MLFHSKLVNVATTAFQTAVDCCSGVKVGLRNISNETSNYLNYKDGALFLNG